MKKIIHAVRCSRIFRPMMAEEAKKICRSREREDIIVGCLDVEARCSRISS